MKAGAGTRTVTSRPRICLIYDCLYPYTIGGGERWYRNLAERLAADGHQVTYLTLRQWDRDAGVELPGVRVVDVGPRLALYNRAGQRRILPPIIFGAGVLLHLLRNGRHYDAIHTASFPFFSLLAIALLRPIFQWSVLVDWLEFWSREYWRQYLGKVGGRIGWAVQWLCLRVPQSAFCLASSTERRLKAHGINGPVAVLRGLYGGAAFASEVQNPRSFVLAVGRLVPEKRLRLIPSALKVARSSIPDLRAVVVGNGPERTALLAEISALGLENVVEILGVIDRIMLEDLMARALCLVHPSSREGYGLVVVEASAAGTPTILVQGEDNAATELIEDGVNGFVVDLPNPESIAEAIARVQSAGIAMRRATKNWFVHNSDRLSIEASLQQVVAAYRTTVRY